MLAVWLGNSYGTGTVSDSYATCDVTATGGNYGTAGGLIGSVDSGTVRRSYATGTVSSDYQRGRSWSRTPGTFSRQIGRIIDSHATGNVSTATGEHCRRSGGPAVSATAPILLTATPLAMSPVAATAAADAGGLAGTRCPTAGTNVTGSYATGNVSATAGGNYSVGGLVGSICIHWR